MTAQTRRIQPYQGRDGDHESLLNFALSAAQQLDPAFNPPKSLLRREDTDGMQDRMTFVKRWGNEQQGFETTNIIELEPKASGEAVNRMQLRTIGLPEDCQLEMENARVWYDPRYIEITVAGPEATVAQILADFETTFGGTRLDPGQVQLTLLSAQVSLSVGALEAAIMKAGMVLDLEPENIEALLLRAKALVAKGEREQAASVAQHVLELEPGSQEGQQVLDEIATSVE